MESSQKPKHPFHLTRQILIAMGLGMGLGMLVHALPAWPLFNHLIINGVLDVGGKLFISSLKMVVVPIVFVSLVCGTCNLKDSKKFGRLASKTLLLYLLTTAFAITIALFFANLFSVGKGSVLTTANTFSTAAAPPLKATIINMFPTNPINAMAQGNMLQIIIFSILFGLAIAWSGKPGEAIGKFFMDLDKVIMRLITMIIHVAPYGIFCLIAVLFSHMGFSFINQLIYYFGTMLFVLLFQLLVAYPLMLQLISGLNPIPFIKKMFPAMLFAFSTASSNASIPMVIETVEKKIGVRNIIAAFVIPLGATINMDGTAIMQGVATQFIANVYNIDLGLSGYLSIILTATLASIGTAGVPGVGLITLAMVLQQVGLPVEGIALIIGVDRLLDMTRTAVNITGDATIATVVAKSEKALDMGIYRSKEGIEY